MADLFTGDTSEMNTLDAGAGKSAGFDFGALLTSVSNTALAWGSKALSQQFTKDQAGITPLAPTQAGSTGISTGFASFWKSYGTAILLIGAVAGAGWFFFLRRR
jgi:hypothetical protein